MGCDIHSRAEIRLDGEWQMLGDIFPNTSYMRWVVPDQKYLDDLRDGELLDRVSHYVVARVDGEENYKSDMPEIPEDSDLESKIVAYTEAMTERMEWGRSEEGREQVSNDENGNYDRDGWTRFRRETMRKLGETYALTAEERQQVCDAILNYRSWAPDEWVKNGGDADEYDTHEDNLITITETKTSEDDQEWMMNEPLDSRNYTLFAVLANVRNYDGGMTPIADPKGIPEDASAEVKSFSDSYGADGHSHTWLTLSEFDDYNFDDDVTYTGIVSESQYARMVDEGYPDNPYSGPESWAGGIGGGNGIQVFTPESYEKWRAVDTPRLPASHGILYEPNVLPEHLPDEPTGEDVTKVDRWVLQGWTDEKIKKAEKALAEGKSEFTIDSRFEYNGVKPMIHATWKEVRKNVMGTEFKNMLRIFRELVDFHGISSDDVRIVCFFDN